MNESNSPTTKKYWLRGAVAFAIIGFLISWGTFVIREICAKLTDATFQIQDINGDFGKFVINEKCSYFDATTAVWNLVIGVTFAIGGIFIGAILGMLISFIRKAGHIRKLTPQKEMEAKVKEGLTKSGFIPPQYKEEQMATSIDMEVVEKNAGDNVTPVSPILKSHKNISNLSKSELENIVKKSLDQRIV